MGHALKAILKKPSLYDFSGSCFHNICDLYTHKKKHIYSFSYMSLQYEATPAFFCWFFLPLVVSLLHKLNLYFRFIKCLIVRAHISKLLVFLRHSTKLQIASLLLHIKSLLLTWLVFERPTSYVMVRSGLKRPNARSEAGPGFKSSSYRAKIYVSTDFPGIRGVPTNDLRWAIKFPL